MRRPVVVLVGMPGSGKSSVGRAVAARLDLDFRDSDDLVTAATGRTIPDLFAESEEVFRTVETGAVLAALETFDGVLALGGGSLLSAPVREAVAASGVPVVLLRAGLATLTARVGSGVSRPLLAADPARRLAALAGERAALYADAAQVTVDTDDLTVAEVAEMVLAATIEASVAEVRP